jgi:hypothetical protein
LSCAQHRNVVMLIGLCVEDRRRLLVYEYICNGSLDSHLYGKIIFFLAFISKKRQFVINHLSVNLVIQLTVYLRGSRLVL